MNHSTSAHYYHHQFPLDCRAVAAALDTSRHVSICSFVPDFPRARLFSAPAAALRSLERPETFTVTLFWHCLLSQATHAATRQELSDFDRNFETLSLGGLLGSYHSHIHPAFLLIALAFTEFPTAQVEAQLQQIGPRALQALRNLEHGLRQRILSEAAAALSPAALPTSIGAFVPNGDKYRLSPDWDLARKWFLGAAIVVEMELAGTEEPSVTARSRHLVASWIYDTERGINNSPPPHTFMSGMILQARKGELRRLKQLSADLMQEPHSSEHALSLVARTRLSSSKLESERQAFLQSNQ